MNNVAPFVVRTYQMVNDPSTDCLITWGSANNSFVVVDPLDLSTLLLPLFFNHNNFSSFVRQLNAYGFKKVDPERWEFSNEWFLRGQEQLLKNVVRRKNTVVEREIERMKREQIQMEEELRGMTRRLETTERRPVQTVDLLCKVAVDPEILTRVRQRRAPKKRRTEVVVVAAEEETRKPPYPFSLFGTSI